MPQRAERSFNDGSGVRIGRERQSVVHPLAFSPGGHDARLPQIGKVPGNLGLGRADHFREIADAYLLRGDQIEQPEPGPITQSAEQTIQRVISVHVDSLTEYIRLDECVHGCYGHRIR